MRDDIDAMVLPSRKPVISKSKSLHALGAFYLRQGFPKQGLSLLLAAKDYGAGEPSLDRAIAHAYLLCGAPKKTIEILDMLDVSNDDFRMAESARLLRSRALLAMGRVQDAQAVRADDVPRRPARLSGPGRSR